MNKLFAAIAVGSVFASQAAFAADVATDPLSLTPAATATESSLDSMQTASTTPAVDTLSAPVVTSAPSFSSEPTIAAEPATTSFSSEAVPSFSSEAVPAIGASDILGTPEANTTDTSVLGDLLNDNSEPTPSQIDTANVSKDGSSAGTVAPGRKLTQSGAGDVAALSLAGLVAAAFALVGIRKSRKSKA